MSQENAGGGLHKQHAIPTKKGDDTMSAVAQNYVYEVCGKKDTAKKEPVVTKDRLAQIKATVGKYLIEKK